MSPDIDAMIDENTFLFISKLIHILIRYQVHDYEKGISLVIIYSDYLIHQKVLGLYKITPHSHTSSIFEYFLLGSTNSLISSFFV